MKHSLLRIVPGICVFCGLCLFAAAQEPVSVVGKWADPMMEGITFEFKDNKTGVMVVFGVDARFVWQQKEKEKESTFLLVFPPEKDVYKAVLDKEGKKLLYYGKKETVTPEFTMRRVK